MPGSAPGRRQRGDGEHASPVRKMPRRPSRSPSRPASSSRPPKAIMYALTTQARLASENPRSSRIAGSATFTMVMSRTIISIPVQRTIRAANRRRSDAFSGMADDSVAERWPRPRNRGAFFSGAISRGVLVISGAPVGRRGCSHPCVEAETRFSTAADKKFQPARNVARLPRNCSVPSRRWSLVSSPSRKAPCSVITRVVPPGVPTISTVASETEIRRPSMSMS